MKRHTAISSILFDNEAFVKIKTLSAVTLILLAGLLIAISIGPLGPVSAADVGTVSTSTDTLVLSRKSGSSAVNNTGVIFYFGGYESSARTDIYIYNPSNDTCWDSGDDLPAGLHSSKAFWYNTGSCFHILGGAKTAGDTNEILRYWPANGTCSVSSATLPRSMEPDGCWTGTYFYILGGGVDGVPFTHIYRYDPSSMTTTNLTNTQSVSVPAGRRTSQCCWDSDNNRAYIIGGRDSGGTYQADIYWFTPANYSCWDTNTNYYDSLGTAGCVYDPVNDTVYIAGGYDGSNKLDDIGMYTPGDGNSRACNNLTGTSRQTTAEYYDDNVYILGGESSAPVNTIWIFETPGASETSSTYTLSGLDSNDRITWTGEGGETIWSNATTPGGTLNITMDVNSSDNITQINVFMDDLGGDIDASNITMYVSVDNNNFAVLEHNPGNGNGVFPTNGGNLSINTSTWPSSGAGSNPFDGSGITDTNVSIYCRFTLSIPASETSSTTYTQDDWKVYGRSGV